MTKSKGRSSTLSIRNIWRRKVARRDPQRLCSNWRYSLLVQTQAIRKGLRGVLKNRMKKWILDLILLEARQLMLRLIDSIIHFVILKVLTISWLIGRVMKFQRRLLIKTAWRTSILRTLKQSSKEFNKPIRLRKDFTVEKQSRWVGCSKVA